MSSFQEKLRNLYNKEDQIAPLIEGLEKEIPPQTLDDYYVKLKTIIKEDSQKKSANYEAISGKKQEIEIEDLFDPLSSEETTNEAPINKLLILGGAGVGKSTLMQYIAYRWSKGELWNDKFNYVYRVSLKILLKEGWNNSYIQRSEDDDLLKCLVHYHFISKLDLEERKNYHLKDLPWLNEKDKMLLLLDGYDEVNNLSKDISEILLKSIFKHANIILTSRPNAIDRDMAQNFERKIENIGFDHDGINQYLTWYFKKDEAKDKAEDEARKKKGEALEEFLEKNSSIRETCKIPVNIAMMCFIWSEADSNQALYTVSNMSDLYHQVVDRLGFRYYTKQPSNLGKNENVLLAEWRGEKQLDELRVLQHIAYKGLTGGGIEVSDEKRIETLIIAGMLAKGDEIGISIQSSINYLQNTELKREMPIINQVYKYGLLRPEGILVTNKEPSETDLQSHKFSFIHLSFQEFLAAQYFAERLMKDENQTNFASFLAHHRNEPRYFLTLKFMAGFLSRAQDPKAAKPLGVFWDAIMCNTDGVIESGVENKVTLLMHLLSQATKEEKIDERVPNRDRAVDLIDSVVLGDLSRWSTQLKESGYSSDNIKEGLIQYFVNHHFNWLRDKSLDLKKKLNPNIKDKADNSHPSLEEIIEIIRFMINKFSEQQQNEMFLKACDILKDYNETKWRPFKKAIEFILTIFRKTKLKIEVQKKREILGYLLFTAYNNNLDELSCKAIHEILSSSSNPLLNEVVLKHLRQEFEGFKREKKYFRLNIIANILFQNNLGDHLLVEGVIQFLTTFFQDNDLKVSLSAFENVIEFLNKSEKKNLQLVNNTLQTLINLLQSKTSISDSVSKYIVKIIKISGNDPQLIRATTRDLISCFAFFGGETFQKSLSRTLMELVKMNLKTDIQSVREDLGFFSILLKGPSQEYYFKRGSKLILEVVKGWSRSDSQLIRDCLNNLIKLIQDPYLDMEKPFEKIFIGLIKLNDQDQDQLIRGTVNNLIQLLHNSPSRTRCVIFRIFQHLVSLSHKNDLQVVRTIFQASIQFLLKEYHSFSERFVQTEVFNLIKDMRNDELIQDALDIFTPILQDPHKHPSSLTILDLVHSSVNNKIQFAQSLLNNLLPLLQDSQIFVRISASETIVCLMGITGENNTQLARNISEVLTPLLEDTGINTAKNAFNILLLLVQGHGCRDNHLAMNIFEILTPMLKDPDLMWLVTERMICLMERNPTNVQLVRNIFETLIPLLKNINWVEFYNFDNLINLLKTRGSTSNQLAMNIFEVLTLKLKDPNYQREAIKKMINLMEKSASHNNQLVKDIFKTLDPIFIDQERNFRELSQQAIRLAMEVRGETDTQLIRDSINALIPLLDLDDSSLGKVTYYWISQLMKESEKSELQIVQDILDDLTPFLYENQPIVRGIVSKAVIQLLKISSNKDTELPKTIMTMLISLLKTARNQEKDVVLSAIFELGDITGLNDDYFIDAMNSLIPFLLQDRSTLNDILKLARINSKRDDKLAKYLFQTLSPLFNVKSEKSEKPGVAEESERYEKYYEKNDKYEKPELRNSVFTIIIEIMKLSKNIDTQLAQEIFNMLISTLKQMDSLGDREAEIFPTESIIKNLIELARNTPLVKEAIITSLQFLNHSHHNLNRAGSMLLRMVVLKILLDAPNNLTPYFNHSSKKLRDILISSLLECLKHYIQRFELLEQLFQDPKSSLTLQNIEKQFDKKMEFSDQLTRNIQECLRKLETKDLSKDDYSQHLSALKSLFAAELNQINNLKGPQIIELALVVISQEKNSADDLDRQRLIEIAKEVLKIQVNYLNDDGFRWINDNHENLVSLSTENSKSFDRKVFLKLLKHEKMNPLEESLLIKFIKQGLTTSLTRDGEIIFEGSRHKLKGDNISQAMEKIAKTILDQQQDLLALQYKQHEPIFVKSKAERGMKRAAIDYAGVKSIVDKRHKLKIDSWLLTTLKSPKLESEIIILEKRSAFGDHLIYHLSDKKSYKLYPNEAPAVNEIFGSYLLGRYYSGEVKELTDEVGQQLFEGKHTNQISQIKGDILSKQTYFQQELLGEGSEDRNQGIEKILENKLDNNCAILEDDLESLSLSEPQTLSIQAYCRGFVSTVSQRFISSQMKADGSFVIDDGRACFNTVNLFFQLSGRDSSGVGYVIAETIDSVRSYFKTAPIINEAHLVKNIAIDVVELSNLAWKTVLEIIKIEKNRQRIFDAEDAEQVTCWKTIKNCFAGLCPCHKVPNKIKGQIIKEWCQKLQNKIKKWKTNNCCQNLQNCFKECRYQWKYHKLPQLPRDERDFQRAPAYHLGVEDAQKMIEAWIGLNDSSPHLQMNQKEKIEKFADEAVADPERKKECCSWNCFCSGVCSCFHWVWDKIC